MRGRDGGDHRGFCQAGRSWEPGKPVRDKPRMVVSSVATEPWPYPPGLLLLGGKDHGRALLKTKKPLFEQRLAELRTELEKFQAEIKEDLQKHLEASREAVIKYYIPRVTEHPPDSLSGCSLPSPLRDLPLERDAVGALSVRP